MKVFKPLQTSLIHKTFLFRGMFRLAIGVLIGFPFDGGEPLLEPDMWKLAASEIGKDGLLDVGMPKPNGEVLVYGSYFAANKASVSADGVRLKIGNIDKTLLVYGNRYWRPLIGASEPEQFQTMPIDYAHAFGGADFAKNPLGKGIVDVDVFGEKRRPLPNIEHPDDVMSTPGQRPAPAGFGPLDMAWEFRASKLGTYDNKWIRENWPGYPDDLDWNHFNTAPSDQWVNGFFKGIEEFELFNMNPDKKRVNGQLPSYRTRCFVNREQSEKDEIEEIKMNLETVWLFPHTETGIVLYRGVINVDTDDAGDVNNIIIGYENNSDTPRDISHYTESLASRLDPATADKYMLNSVDLIPNGARCGFGAIDVGGDDHSNGSGTIESDDEQINEQPFFPRPLDHELITSLRTTKNDIRKLNQNEQVDIGDSTVVTHATDVESLLAKLTEAENEMKDGYRAQAHLIEKGRPFHENNMDSIRQELIKRLERKEDVSGWDFAGLDLSNMNLSGVNFKGCYLEGVDFSNSNLSGANLENAIIPFADLTKCNLSSANLKRANIGSSNLSEAIIDGSDLSQVILGKSSLMGAKITNCDLSDVDLFEAVIGNADFSGSQLANTQFFELYLSQAKFRKTNLTGSTFTKCSLYGSDLSGAILDGVTWIECTLDEVDFSDSSMRNTRFPGGCTLSGSRFIRSVLDSSNFRSTDLTNTDFSEAIIDMCDFGGANAQQANFTRAIARMAQFISTDLGEADLSSINMMKGTLMKARLTNASLRNANCYGVEFMDATVGKTEFVNTLLSNTKLAKWRPS